MHARRRLCLAALVAALFVMLTPEAKAVECAATPLSDVCLSAVDETLGRSENPLSELDPEVTAAIRALPWAKSNVSKFEQRVIYRLENIARLSPDLFWYFVRDMEVPWYRGSIPNSIAEFYYQPTSETLGTFDLLVRIAGLPWVRDGLAESERLAAWILYGSTAISPEYIETLLRKKWLRDGINRTETNVLDELYNSWYSLTLFPGNPQVIGSILAQVAAMPFMDSIEGYEARTFSNVTLVYGRTTQALQAIMAHLDSKGGITDEHELVFRLHGGDQEYIETFTDILDPTQIDQFLVDPASRGIVIENRWITLPLAGPVQLMAIRDGPASSQTMNVLEQMVRLLEGTMEEPFPHNTIALEIEGPHTSAIPGGVRFDEREFRLEQISHETVSILMHELAHQYWTGATTWIVEGAATFMQIQTGLEDSELLESLSFGCVLDRLVDLPYGTGERSVCPYSLGGSLFFELYSELGKDEFQRGFRSLYRAIDALNSSYRDIVDGDIWIDDPDSGNYCDYCEGMDPALYHVRRAFVDEADPASAAVAHAIVNRWYFGE